MLNALAIVLEQPERLALSRLDLTPPGEGDVVVRSQWSGISTGTERLLFSGRMPTFPGMGYPLVPGYETVGTIVHAGAESGYREGQTVFVPGSRCFGPVRGLFGGAASQLVTPASRIVEVPVHLGETAILLALAATALHARAGNIKRGRELIVGHGVLGRLLARLSVLEGGEPPVVWETNPARCAGADGYEVTAPEEDSRKDYATIFDVSGDPDILDKLIARLSPGGEIVLAGFYDRSLSFAFPPAFMREARLRVAAEWRASDLAAVKTLIERGALSLGGLITHREPATNASAAYPRAFEDPACLKMVLDWRTCQ
jgi:bacteriochlorophyllide a dehydrogenase